MGYQEHDGRPFHQRMDSVKVGHLHNVLRHLRGGSIGFDPFRDTRTATKDACISFLHAEFLNQQLDDAHAALVASYGAGHKFSERRSRRSSRAASADTSAAATTTATTSASTDAASQLAALLAQIAGASVTEARVTSIVQAHLAGIVSDMQAKIEAAVKAAEHGAVVVELKVHDLPPISAGLQHHKFPLLAKVVNTRLQDGTRVNAWLGGPAGVSKTHSCKALAKALGLPFAFSPPVDQPYALIGYKNSAGELVRTPFMDCWEKGGIFLFDECSGSSNSALMAFQGALANGVCPFPHGMIERHPDCIIICADNTMGNAASTEYVGSNKLNAAFLDRFFKIKWEIDPALEAALCTNEPWLQRVRAVRERVKVAGVRHLVTPRATLIGQALLANGIAQADVEAGLLRGGLDDVTWGKVS